MQIPTSHNGVVQGLPSSQSASVSQVTQSGTSMPTHSPPIHVSSSVQALPSSHVSAISQTENTISTIAPGRSAFGSSEAKVTPPVPSARSAASVRTHLDEPVAVIGETITLFVIATAIAFSMVVRSSPGSKHGLPLHGPSSPSGTMTRTMSGDQGKNSATNAVAGPHDSIWAPFGGSVHSHAPGSPGTSVPNSSSTLSVMHGNLPFPVPATPRTVVLTDTPSDSISSTIAPMLSQSACPSSTIERDVSMTNTTSTAGQETTTSHSSQGLSVQFRSGSHMPSTFRHAFSDVSRHSAPKGGSGLLKQQRPVV